MGWEGPERWGVGAGGGGGGGEGGGCPGRGLGPAPVSIFGLQAVCQCLRLCRDHCGTRCVMTAVDSEPATERERGGPWIK